MIIIIYKINNQFFIIPAYSIKTINWICLRLAKCVKTTGLNDIKN
jgi:hypothetical protein